MLFHEALHCGVHETVFSAEVMVHEPVVHASAFCHVAHTHRSRSDITEQFCGCLDQFLFGAGTTGNGLVGHLPAVA